MAEEPDPMVCDSCGRRFSAPTILESGRCPLCDGYLVPLDQDPFRRPGPADVPEDGNR